MKIAIISDIHSNLESLTECVRIAQSNGAQKFVCLGDCVGYGPDPVAVLDLLQSLPGFLCVVGNHDEYMFNSVDIASSAPVIVAANWTRKQLSKSHLDFLKSLSYVEIENGVTYVHASLNQPGSWAYMTDTAQVQDCLNASTTNLTFYGHVHIPMIFHEKPDDSLEFIQPQGGEEIYLHQNHRYVINVGSVGQPRDDNCDACFVIYDEEPHSVTFHRVAYNKEHTIEKMRQKKLPKELADRLEFGY